MGGRGGSVYNCVIKSMTRWKKNTTFRLVPFLISCWLSNSKEPLNVSFSLKNRSKTFHQQRKMKIFHISFYYYFVSRGEGEGRKGKGKVIYYTHILILLRFLNPSPSSRTYTKISAYFNSFCRGKFLIARVRWMMAGGRLKTAECEPSPVLIARQKELK